MAGGDFGSFGPGGRADDPLHSRIMFVQCSAVVERPFDEVDAALAGIGDGLGESAAVAYRKGEDLVASLVGPVGMAKTVLLDVGRPMHRPGKTTLPLSWKASGPSGLFPTMDADLTIEAVGDGRTEVMFQGRYEPPLGVVGRALDRFALHRFAEISVKDFVDRVAEALASPEARVPDPG